MRQSLSPRPNPPSRSPRRAAAVLIGAALAASGGWTPAHAQPASPEDWPCVQVLVPEVSPAVLWPLPIDASTSGTWREAPAIRKLAKRLAEAEQVDDDTRTAIDAFAASVPEDARERALTQLADGTVALANERRTRYLDGIRRYTRQQIAIAGQIESTLNRLAELDDAAVASGTAPGSASFTTDEDTAGVLVTDAATVPGRRAIEETLVWHERLYDQRERAIRALCERPVELEEMVSELLREMAYRLPEA